MRENAEMLRYAQHDRLPIRAMTCDAMVNSKVLLFALLCGFAPLREIRHELSTARTEVVIGDG